MIMLLGFIGVWIVLWLIISFFMNKKKRQEEKDEE